MEDKILPEEFWAKQYFGTEFIVEKEEQCCLIGKTVFSNCKTIGKRHEADPKIVKQVDLKLTTKLKESEPFLKEFLSNGQEEKVLHVNNNLQNEFFGENLNWVLELLDNTEINGRVQLELVNKPFRGLGEDSQTIRRGSVDWKTYENEIFESTKILDRVWPCERVIYYHYHEYKGCGVYYHSTRIPIKPEGDWLMYRPDRNPSPTRPFRETSLRTLRGSKEASEIASKCQRNWKDEPVPQSDIDVIVETAMNMPTKQNVLMYELFVFTGRNEIDFLYDISPPPGIESDQKWRNAQIRAPLVLAWFIAKDVHDTVHSSLPEDEVYTYSTTSPEARNLNVGISSGAAALTAGQLGYHTGFNCCFQLDKLQILAQHKRPGIGPFVLSLGIGTPVDGIPRNHIPINDHLKRPVIIKTEELKKDKIIHYFT